MSLRSLDLDDRTFDELVATARARIAARCPAWTDLSPSDPGMTLVETFAWLTETLLYRLNRVPEKAYVEFLRLAGVDLRPPHAARVEVLLTRQQADETLTLPRGLTLSAGGGDGPVFDTVDVARFEPGVHRVSVRAVQGPRIEGERLGQGEGRPGQAFLLSRRPVAVVAGRVQIELGIEVEPDAVAPGTPTRQFSGRVFAITTYDERAGRRPEGAPFEVDPIGGRIVAAVPAGREVRVWYRVGATHDGNLPAGALDRIVGGPPGIRVENPQAATGWRPPETHAEALARGPGEIFGSERVITARDYERLALSHGAIGRARAITAARLWQHAAPGTVELLLVPATPGVGRGDPLPLSALSRGESADALAALQDQLDDRVPLGVRCTARWARYKPVRVHARVVGVPTASVERLAHRLRRRLDALVSPIGPDGWPFGETLRASDVYHALLADPGVRYVEGVRFTVDGSPTADVRAVCADRFQPHTWFAAAGDALHRTVNGGESWEAVRHVATGEVACVETARHTPGLLAVAVDLPAADTDGAPARSRVMISADLGESWPEGFDVVVERVHDLAWLDRAGRTTLLLATDVGLYVLDIGRDRVVRRSALVIDPDAPHPGLYAVETSMVGTAGPTIAVAAQNAGGVYLTHDIELSAPWRKPSLDGRDIRTLAVQSDGARAFLWAGALADSDVHEGHGCFRLELRGRNTSLLSWQPLAHGWAGGGCYGLTFAGDTVFAGTWRGGVLRLDSGVDGAAWAPCGINCGLPLVDAPRSFERITGLACHPAHGDRLIAGGPEGLFVSTDGGGTFSRQGMAASGEAVTLPPTWIFVSGDHDLDVSVPHEER